MKQQTHSTFSIRLSLQIKELIKQQAKLHDRSVNNQTLQYIKAGLSLAGVQHDELGNMELHSKK